jgi:hypothetical protein
LSELLHRKREKEKERREKQNDKGKEKENSKNLKVFVTLQAKQNLAEDKIA